MTRATTTARLLAMRFGTFLSSILILLSACGSESTPFFLNQDGATVSADGAQLDLVPHFDVYIPLVRDSGNWEAGCALGTASNCSFCGDTCGSETSQTQPVCQNNACNIQCKDEYYDVNGSAADGCEFPDDLPVHDIKAEALDMGVAEDCDDAHTISAVLPSDDRLHLVAPTDRPNGRADWFKLRITDEVMCIVNSEVTVSFSNHPPAASYRAVATYVCDDGTELNPDSKLTNGGGSVTLMPQNTCTMAGDDTGHVYIKVTKESGPHSGALYYISVEP